MSGLIYNSREISVMVTTMEEREEREIDRMHICSLEPAFLMGLFPLIQ